MIAVTGNTYKNKEAIKALGFRWYPQLKTWMKKELAEGDLEELEALQGLIVEKDAEEIADTRSSKEKGGTCIDAPCCGCCGENPNNDGDMDMYEFDLAHEMRDDSWDY